MKAKILASLKNKYAHLGFGERAFDGVADYLSKTVEKEEDIETAILGVESLLKAFQADADKVRTEKASAEKRLSELQDQVKTLGGAPDRKDEPEKRHRSRNSLVGKSPYREQQSALRTSVRHGGREGRHRPQTATLLYRRKTTRALAQAVCPDRVERPLR